MPAGEESEIPLEEVSAPATIAARQPSAIVADVRLREGWLATITNKPVLARREFHRARSIGYSDTTAPALLANRVLTNQPLPDLPESLAVSSTPLNGRAGLNAALQPRPPKGTGANEPTLELAGVNVLLHHALVLQSLGHVYRAQSLSDAILSRRGRSLTNAQRSFAHYLRGQSRFKLANPLEWEMNAVIADFETSVKLAPQSLWADHALFLAGNLEWNGRRNTDRAQTH